MQATLTPTRTGFDLAATLADAWLAVRTATTNLALAWYRAEERRRTERALRELSPYLLRDLGLDSSDIPSIAAACDTHRDTTRRLLAHN
jgi:uncharacterized protein YjiS (DUF1127 family)